MCPSLRGEPRGLVRQYPAESRQDAPSERHKTLSRVNRTRYRYAPVVQLQSFQAAVDRCVFRPGGRCRLQVLGVLKKCSSERSEARQAITAERGGWSGISSLRHHCQGELDAGAARQSFAVAAAETFQQPFLFERMAFTDPFPRFRAGARRGKDSIGTARRAGRG